MIKQVCTAAYILQEKKNTQSLLNMSFINDDN